MKLTITRSNLLAALSACVPIAKQKTTMPILSCVLMTAELMRLKLSATNLQQTVSTSTPCDAHDVGSIAVNAKDLIERVKTFPEGVLTLAVDGTMLLVTSGKRKHKLPVHDGADFPVLAAPPEGGMTIPCAMFRGLLELARPAVCEDLDRPGISCLKLELEGSTLRALATDGKRGHIATETLPTVPPPMVSTLLPVASVDALLAILDDKGDVTIGHGASSGNEEFGVKAGETVFTTKSIASDFPPLMTYFSTQGPVAFNVAREQFTDSLRSVALSTPDGDLAGKVSLSVDGDEVGLAGDGKGAASDSFTLAEPATGQLAVDFFAPYMIDAMAQAETVRIAAGPTELSPVYVIGPKLTAVVMPCRR